jgi:hypothetical protein
MSSATVARVGQVGNLRTDWQSVHPGTARTVAHALLRAASRLISTLVPAVTASPLPSPDSNGGVQ